MKISDVRSLVLQHEMEEPLGYSQAYFTKRTAHLVVVETDEGLTGVGEAFGAGNVALGNKAIVEQVLRPMLLGRNPLDIQVLWHEVYNALRDHGQKGMPIQALSGVDIALWDILGKATGLPLYQLLGGKARESVLAYGYGMMFRKVDDLAAVFNEEAAAIAEMGFKAQKMKIGLGREMDLRLAEAVRNGAGPAARLMADANHAYTPGEAIAVGLGLRDLGFYWFEEPVMPEDYEGYRMVKAALPGLLIAGGEAEFTRFGMRELISRRCVDILQPEVAGTGGVSEFMKILALAQAYGTPVIPHVWGSDVLIATDLHLAAALPDIPGGLAQFEPMLEYDTTFSRFREELLTEPLDIRGQVKRNGGRVKPPEKPGLGIDLNWDFVEATRVA